MVDDLREHERGPTGWFDDIDEWRAVIQRVFTEPAVAAMPGWESLDETRDRVVPAVRRILTDHPDDEVVLAGHGTAWTLVRSELTGERALTSLDEPALPSPDSTWGVQVRRHT